MAVTIKINEINNKFFTMIEGQEAQLSYRILKGGVYDFYHTFVPTALRNRGIASDLVAYGLGFARKHGHKVVPSCPYVRAYVDAHSEWRDLIVDDGA